MRRCCISSRRGEQSPSSHDMAFVRCMCRWVWEKREFKKADSVGRVRLMSSLRTAAIWLSLCRIRRKVMLR
jgi:hypothetical protein